MTIHKLKLNACYYDDAQLVKDLKAYEATPYCPNCGGKMEDKS